MDALLHAIKAASDPTRLRILVVLAANELTVGEMCTVLGQSQPRVSRHLKILHAAGLLNRQAEGTSAIYSRARQGLGRQVYDSLVALVDPDDQVVERDGERLASVRAQRAETAAAYFDEIAASWDLLRDRHVGDAYVEAAMLAAVDDIEIADLIDIGTGTGRVLEVFADRAKRGLGIDTSRKMLTIARSRLAGTGAVNCLVRPGDATDLQVAHNAFDVATIHQVLHFLTEPDRAIRAGAQALRPGGRLLVVDFAPHAHDELRSNDAHQWLGFSDAQVHEWFAGAGLDVRDTVHLVPTAAQGDDALTVTLWIGEKPINSHLAEVAV